MNAYSETDIQQLCRRLQIDTGFFQQCLDESVIEIQKQDDALELRNASALRLRRLQRLCDTLSIDPPVALLLSDLLRRVSELEAALARTGQNL